jgi:hypothetical protein
MDNTTTTRIHQELHSTAVQQVVCMIAPASVQWSTGTLQVLHKPAVMPAAPAADIPPRDTIHCM